MSPTTGGRRIELRRALAESLPASLARAAHPRTALATSAVVAVAAVLSGRTPGELIVVAASMLAAQVFLGWDNDLVDERRDRTDDRGDKQLVKGTLDRGTLWFAQAIVFLILVPLAVANGSIAGLTLLTYVIVGVGSNRLPLRNTWLSWLAWLLSFALVPAFLSYGGDDGDPPTYAMTAAAALTGLGVHVLLALRGLVDDNRAGRRHLPLCIALKTGAPRLLWLTIAWLVLCGAGLLALGATTGLRQ